MGTENIKEKYEAVGNMLDDALKKTQSIHLTGEEENAELTAIISTLKEINSEFKLEIDKLEASSEWDRYCIAFFGETNAGKSTIIDSLRIIYDEEQRRAELAKQEKEYLATLSKHCENYQELLSKLKEINSSLSTEKKPTSLTDVLKGIGLVVLGIAIGLIVSFLGVI
nr:hypothetical protein [Clostridia bacterium]